MTIQNCTKETVIKSTISRLSCLIGLVHQMNDIQRVSVCRKIVMAFGAFLVLGAIFIMSSPLIGFVVLIMGFVAIIRGYGMKQGPPTPISSTGATSISKNRSSFDNYICSQIDPKIVPSSQTSEHQEQRSSTRCPY